jgi:hypothetical protein
VLGGCWGGTERGRGLEQARISAGDSSETGCFNTEEAARRLGTLRRPGARTSTGPGQVLGETWDQLGVELEWPRAWGEALGTSLGTH